MRYSPERKEAVLRKMMPPHNRTIKQLASESLERCEYLLLVVMT